MRRAPSLRRHQFYGAASSASRRSRLCNPCVAVYTTANICACSELSQSRRSFSTLDFRVIGSTLNHSSTGSIR